jgi:hypothetical protein
MAIEIITKDDLQSFRFELLKDLKELFNNAQPHKPKQWIKSREVRRILQISPGTLQNLRVNGKLRYTKIGGIIYYSYQDIEKVLEEGLSPLKAKSKDTPATLPFIATSSESQEPRTSASRDLLRPII